MASMGPNLDSLFLARIPWSALLLNFSPLLNTLAPLQETAPVAILTFHPCPSSSTFNCFRSASLHCITTIHFRRKLPFTPSSS
ncbi:unnamed protein product [Jaminaea pallidilutea]